MCVRLKMAERIALITHYFFRRGGFRIWFNACICFLTTNLKGDSSKMVLRCTNIFILFPLKIINESYDSVF
jgi:hypothetical protein